MDPVPVSERKNVLFILVDTLRADIIIHEGKNVRLSSINGLKRRGTMFTQAIATTTTTTPSIASLFTGVYPPTHGIRSLSGYTLNPAIKTAAQIFKENGYYTIAELTGPLSPEIGLNRGFDEYNFREPVNNTTSPWFDNLLDRFAKKTINKPWFCFLHLFDIHLPRVVPKPFNSPEYGIASYERAISHIDEKIGRLLACTDKNTMIVLSADHGEKIPQSYFDEIMQLKIKKLPIIRQVNTLLKKNQKNRELLRSVGHGFHVYEYLVRIPLIFVDEGIFPEGLTIDRPVRQVDIFPTIIDALHLKLPEHYSIDGQSLIPAVHGKEEPVPPAYVEACGHSLPKKELWLLGIRTAQYKYVYAPYADDPQEELFDIQNDPNEKYNLFNSNRDIAKSLRTELDMIVKKGLNRQYFQNALFKVRRKINN